MWVPVAVYLLIAAGTLGVAAFTASANMIADQPKRDIWQHIAAVQALMDNLASPHNPFVASLEPSRHFQPLWAATAGVANALDLTVWQAMTGATFAIMITLAFAIHLFARTFFGSPWAPSVLLFVMLFGWWLPHGHTGLHSIWTLLYGAAYPATFLIALSLIQWALAIRALSDLRYLVAIVPLSALMLATHQLGAVIGCIGAFSFAVAQPGAPHMRRLAVLAAIAAGCALAFLWPYYNPLELMLRPGNSTWEDGPDFYSPPWAPNILVPSGLGLLWLRHREARPLALALVLYGGLYLLGLFGIQIASRFLMPVVLVLHIAMAGLVLEAMSRFTLRGPLIRRAVPWLAVAVAVTVSLSATRIYQLVFDARYAEAPDLYAAAVELTRDLPDGEEVAALGITAWSVVGTGQRVLSVPWPEPGISDLAERQEKTRSLFDPALSPEARRALADDLGIRVLIVDERLILPADLEAVAAAAVASSSASTLHRFDLRR